MNCPLCRTPNPDDSRICAKCASILPSSDETLLYPSGAAGGTERGHPPGTVIAGRYRILLKIGRGGMGVVYKAEDTRLDRPVALKFLPPGLTSREDAKVRFIQEARAASILDHRNICIVYEIDAMDDGQMYIAMPFYDGETLKSMIEHGPVAVGRALDIMIQAAEGLAKAHSQGIVHRDIKPANIILTAEGVVKIVDFGLAKLSSRAELVRSGGFAGTVAYMSPEQARGDDVDERTDIWSLGVVFYELLTAGHPFPGETPSAVIRAVIDTVPLPPRELRSGIPDDAERIVLKCLNKNPAGRYASSAAFLQDLNSLKRSLEIMEERKRAERDKEAEGRKETERRQAVVLSAEFLGYAEILESLDPEEATLVVNRCFGMSESVVRKYGGKVGQITGGSFMAYFGVPTAVEDSPKNALNAAIELRNDLDRFVQDEHLRVPLKLRTGIEAGTVIAGAKGSGEYSILGEAVADASRLKEAAGPGEIFVGVQAHRNTGLVFDFGEPRSVAARGGKGPLPAYLLRSSREKVYRARVGRERMVSSEMVGRRQELDLLKRRVLEVIGGRGAIVSVIGEAGIGKSRLIAELSRTDEMNQTLFLMGRALSIGKNLSFHPLIDILKSWARIKDDDSPSVLAEKLERTIADLDPEGAAEIFPFVATMMGIKLKGRPAERIEGIEGEALEKLILKSLRELVVKAAGLRPVVIAVEDLHWSDRTSLGLLESLCRLAETSRVLFINLFRPDHPDTSDRFLETIRNRYPGFHVEIVLEPLKDREGETLIENLLNVQSLPAHIRELIARRAEGNPLFIEEVARSFIDQGVVEVNEGGFRITDRINSVVIPETIREILMARIDALEEETKSLLKIASVIGRNFFHRILARVARTIEGIDDRLEFLKDVQLIKERRRMEELEYLFKHALIQEAAYESIPPKKRKELHLKVAEAIETVFSERLREFYGMLAFHFSSGENLEKAEEYLVRAGREALESAASSEALHYYQEALRLYEAKHGDRGDAETVARLEWSIAKALLHKGRMTDAVTHFDRVLELWGDRKPKPQAWVYVRLFFSLISVLRSLYLPGRKKKLIPTAKMNEIFEATYQRGTALVSVDTRRMVTDSIRFLGTIRKYDLEKIPNGVTIYASSSALFFFSGLSFPIARRLLDYAKSHLRPGDAKAFLTYRFWELAMDTLWGRWRSELGYDADAVDRNIRDGDLFTAPGLVFWGGLLVTEQGRFPETRVFVDKLGEIGDVYENDYARSRRMALNIRYLLVSRSLGELLPEADQGIAWLASIGQSFWALYVSGLRAQAKILVGDLPGAENALAEARRLIADENRIAPFYLSTYRLSRFLLDLCLLESALRGGDATGAARRRKNAVQSGKEALKTAAKCATIRTEALRARGTLDWLRGKRKSALAWWTKSLEAGDRLGAEPELARTWREIGTRLGEAGDRLRGPNGTTARECLAHAGRGFANLGLRWDIEAMDRGGPGPGM